jgi:hypothetical protein
MEAAAFDVGSGGPPIEHCILTATTVPASIVPSLYFGNATSVFGSIVSTSLW